VKTLDEEKLFIEQIGVIAEKLGEPPLQSRIMSLFLIRMPEPVSFDELVEFFGASKSSVSNALKFFLHTNAISYFTKPGDRKRYFHLPDISIWLGNLKGITHRFNSIILLLNSIVDYKRDEEWMLEEDFKDLIILIERLKFTVTNEIEKFLIEKGKLKKDSLP
jgi:DNA-binding transcriptional regulator GbsR (MarR family)